MRQVNFLRPICALQYRKRAKISSIKKVPKHGLCVPGSWQTKHVSSSFVLVLSINDESIHVNIGHLSFDPNSMFIRFLAYIELKLNDYKHFIPSILIGG